MDRIFWPLLPAGFLLAILILPVVVGRVLLRRTRVGAISRVKGIGLYALAVLSPPVLYLGMFFALVGIEELSGAALIPEEIGRSLLPITAIGLFVWLPALVIYAFCALRAGRR